MARTSLELNEKMVEGGVTILSISGDLDANTTPQLRERLDALVAGGSVNIVCDCQELNYISSAGIGAMNATLKAVAGKNGKLVLFGVNKVIYDTLELMYFTKKVKIAKKIEEAIKAAR